MEKRVSELIQARLNQHKDLQSLFGPSPNHNEIVETYEQLAEDFESRSEAEVVQLLRSKRKELEDTFAQAAVVSAPFLAKTSQLKTYCVDDLLDLIQGRKPLKHFGRLPELSSALVEKVQDRHMQFIWTSSA
jgi:hypothetical protein